MKNEQIRTTLLIVLIVAVGIGFYLVLQNAKKQTLALQSIDSKTPNRIITTATSSNG